MRRREIDTPGSSQIAPVIENLEPGEEIVSWIINPSLTEPLILRVADSNPHTTGR